MTGDPPPKKPAKQVSTPSSAQMARKNRLAEELRANLKRRKAAARRHKDTDDGGSSSDDNEP
jgi:hypothetical protein